MKTICLGISVAMILSCLSGVSYAAVNCQISSITSGTIGVKTSDDRSLSSKPSEAAQGSAGSFQALCTTGGGGGGGGNPTGRLSITTPIRSGSIPPLTPVYDSPEAGIYTTSAGTDAAITVSGGSQSSPISFSGSQKKYYTHMSVTASNPILPGSYTYNVTVTLSGN